MVTLKSWQLYILKEHFFVSLTLWVKSKIKKKNTFNEKRKFYIEHKAYFFFFLIWNIKHF